MIKAVVFDKYWVKWELLYDIYVTPSDTAMVFHQYDHFSKVYIEFLQELAGGPAAGSIAAARVQFPGWELTQPLKS